MYTGGLEGGLGEIESIRSVVPSDMVFRNQRGNPGRVVRQGGVDRRHEYQLRYRKVCRRQGAFSPEQRLWAAVLEQAALDLKRKRPYPCHTGARWQVKAEVVRWFANESEECGAFIWVCEHLGVDYQAVRERLGVQI